MQLRWGTIINRIPILTSLPDSICDIRRLYTYTPIHICTYSRVRASYIHTFIHIYIYILRVYRYIHIYICMYICAYAAGRVILRTPVRARQLCTWTSERPLEKCRRSIATDRLSPPNIISLPLFSTPGTNNPMEMKYTNFSCLLLFSTIFVFLFFFFRIGRYHYRRYRAKRYTEVVGKFNGV